jgi:hypothetical protein
MRRSFMGALLMAGLLALYLWAAGYQGYIMIISGQPIVVVMGVALLVLPLVGAWALWRELSFGFRSAALTRELAALGQLPVDDLPHSPSGRPDRAAADAEFPRYAAEVEADPQSWVAWFRLGLAYDASGDRRRARAAIRRSIALHRG